MPAVAAVTPEQHKHYWDKGWVVIEGVFPRDVVERAAEIAVGLGEQKISQTSASIYVDRSPDGKSAAPRKLDNPFMSDPYFGDMIFSSTLPELVGALMDAPPLFHSDQIFFKPPKHGSPKAYHQDNAYFLMFPDDHVITAWIAMDDVDEHNGCLRYIDGSHKGPILESKPIPGREHDLTPDQSLIDLTKESLARVKKGGVVFHHGKALHCSGPNTSDRWRRGYATHWTSDDVHGENDVWGRGYFLKPELFTRFNGRARVLQK